MMRTIRTSLFVLLLVAAGCSAVRAQGLSGTWKGNYRGGGVLGLLTMLPQQLVVELSLHDDTVLTGASHLYYRGNKYEHYTLVGVVDWKDSTMVFKEDSTLGVFLGFGAGNCLGTYKVKLKVTDSSWRLEGRWKSNLNLFEGGGCPPSGVWLEKPLDKKPQPKVQDKNLERVADIQSLIEIGETERDSVKIELSDNAEIDGDVISVYFNDSTIIKKQKIVAAPQVFYLSLSREEPICRIKMAAESEGSLPPCTALMVITTRQKRYEVTLSSNYNSNATVELFLKE